MILRSKTNLSDDQIAKLSDAEGWQLIYTLKPTKSKLQKKTNQICFTGFATCEKERLGQLAAANGLDVVKAVSQSLAYLVTGPNAGPVKLRNAREFGVAIMNEEQFAKFLADGKMPGVTYAEPACCTTAQVVRADDFGIFDLPVFDTPTAVIDFETTGLSAGMDRVVEVSVVRSEPNGHSEIVFDTLVNPCRRMGATEIHGITDADVADAPPFEEIASGLADAVSGCVIAAYNVYFDMRFFEYEMSRAGFAIQPPYLCLMYLRPLLGLGTRCSLTDACQSHGVPYCGSHMAGDDAEAAARLMEFYWGVMRDEGIRSFRDLSQRGSYKFLQSFGRNVFRRDTAAAIRVPKRLRSRKCPDKNAEAVATVSSVVQPPCNALAVYWDALKAAVADLKIDRGEIENMQRIVAEYGLRQDQTRMLHARAFASVINQFISDQCLDERECEKLKLLHRCLSELGWAPGE